MINFRLIWIFYTILCLFFYIGCVGPPEDEYGPVVTNRPKLFKYNLYCDDEKYSSEDSYELDLVLLDSLHKVITSLIVSDYAGSNQDTSIIITVENDSSIADIFYIKANYSTPHSETPVDSVFYFPKKVSIKTNQFIGNMEFMMVRSNI